MSAVSAKAVVRRALRILNKGANWLKGDFNNGNGSYCALGALREARSFYGDCISRDTYEAARAMVRDSLQDDRLGVNFERSIASFNDYKETTFADINRVFGRAIRGERKKPGTLVVA